MPVAVVTPASPHPQQDPEPASLVVVSNRLPVRRLQERGQVSWKPSPGGLVSAVTPVLRSRRGLWIGWAGQHNLSAPDEHDGIALASIRLSRHQVRDYYHGFSNSSIWPLYHDAIRPAEFRTRWWDAYEDVNWRFAEAIAGRAPRGATVWVHDYHLQRVPVLLRRLRPDVRIGFFLHIPFPPPELFRQLPWRESLLEGLLAADLVGFHTSAYAENFRAAAVQLAAARVEAGDLVTEAGESVDVGAFPISIDYRFFDDLAQRPAILQSAARLRGKLGHDRRMVLGVDRLDYTKGIEDRLRAYRQLLDDGRIRPDQCVLVQIAVPSREQIRNYAEQRAAVERLVGEINGRHGEPGRAAVHYVYRSLSIERLVPYYVAADVMTVTPLRDGMNLVAKEYVATRVAEDGVLLLSEFAGAAEELRHATLVNPHDSAGLADAMAACLTIDAATARANMRALRSTVRRHDVHRWAAEFLRALDRAVPRRGSLAADAGTPRRVDDADALLAPAPSWLQ